ncbi:hypothetical protein HHK36_011842 [Tetracentron sinense]|uniref:FAD-binding PCMH-type domain-containing protein n=1 Tax=Tetracentron sinense TaxID=13715 RepID=A0A835DHL2_TETSI|nr:hypothetical protein HHK36_011842 [Tetracentron sinense]
MASSLGSASLILLSIFLLSVPLATSNSISENFLKCLSHYSKSSIPISKYVYSPNNSSYSSVLQSSIQNLRFLSSTNPKPQYIITPAHESHVQASVICSQKHGLQIRVRSGGHDYEGLSYLSDVPFVIIDLVNLRAIDVNVKDNTAWVQAGATIGEVYYQIAEKSNTHGFPAAICPTIGVGGLLSGGGLGTIMRKYGLASDNILDASLVDVNGRILNRKSMGEGLFWAIRGGGGVSFGVILSWKIRLVPVPPTVTVFTVTKTIQEGATKLTHRWQEIAHKFHEGLFMRLIIQAADGENKGETTIQVSFESLFLGGLKELLPLMEKSFPELGLKAEDCNETSWINSTLYFANYRNGESIDVLKNRTLQPKNIYKNKSDFVKKPISEIELEEIWKELLEGEIIPLLIWEPLGGRMSEIRESETPFPHRAGNLYNIQYVMQWEEGGSKASEKHIERMREVYKFMAPYVSKSPRTAYLNYRDLDLGINEEGSSTSYSKASVWGRKYFKNNFKRLALVKSKVDPGNFFRNEQSIPPFAL